MFQSLHFVVNLAKLIHIHLQCALQTKPCDTCWIIFSDGLLFCAFVLLFFVCVCVYSSTSGRLIKFQFREGKKRKKNYFRPVNRSGCKRKSNLTVLASRTYEAGCSDIKISDKLHMIFNGCWFYRTRFAWKKCEKEHNFNKFLQFFRFWPHGTVTLQLFDLLVQAT